MFSAIRWKKYVHVSVSAVSQNHLENICISNIGKNPKSCISAINIYLFSFTTEPFADEGCEMYMKALEEIQQVNLE